MEPVKSEIAVVSSHWTTIICVLGGAVLGLCTVGKLPWWCSPPAFFPLLATFNQTSIRVTAETFFIHGWFFYAVCLSILVISDSAFELFWFLGVSGLAVLHAGFGSFFQCVVYQRRASLLLSFPIGWTVFEFLRFHLTKLADGTGLTLATVGNTFACNPPLGRLASLGGAFLLSTVAVAVATCLYCILFVRPERRRAALIIGTIILVVLFNTWLRKDSYLPSGSSAILVNKVLTSDSFGTLTQEILDLDGNAGDTCDWIIFPETALHWHHLRTDKKADTVAASEELPLQAAVLEFSRRCEARILIGAWVGSNALGWQNSYLVVHDGKVVGRSDKSHPVPVLEAEPGVLAWLIDVSAINPVLINRSVMPPKPLSKPERSAWRFAAIPSLCFDVFFSSSCRDYPRFPNGFIACGLNYNSPDSLELMKSLSVLHARIRALENSCPVVYVASGGLSGVIGSNGQWLRPPIQDAGVQIVQIPGMAKQTAYGQLGDIYAMTMTAFVLAVLCGRGLRRVPIVEHEEKR